MRKENEETISFICHYINIVNISYIYIYDSFHNFYINNFINMYSAYELVSFIVVFIVVLLL